MNKNLSLPKEIILDFNIHPRGEKQPLLSGPKEDLDKVSTAFFETALSIFISVILGLAWWGLREFCSSVLSFESCTGLGLSKVYEDCALLIQVTISFWIVRIASCNTNVVESGIVFFSALYVRALCEYLWDII